jgi:hypothetical protein
MSAISTDLPSTSAAMVTDVVMSTVTPVPLSISARTMATMCRITKKYSVGGTIARSSSLIFSVTLLIRAS